MNLSEASVELLNHQGPVSALLIAWANDAGVALLNKTFGATSMKITCMGYEDKIIPFENHIDTFRVYLVPAGAMLPEFNAHAGITYRFGKAKSSRQGAKHIKVDDM